MKLKTLKATKVFGFMELEVRFNEDLNFLVGVNGSGKTTVLRLINALLLPNFRELLSIDFKMVEINVEEKGKATTIKAESSEETIRLSVSDTDDMLEMPNYSSVEIQMLAAKREGGDEFLDELVRRYADHPVVRAISRIPSPVFLGLERRRESQEREYPAAFVSPHARHERESQRGSRARRMIRGSLGMSLMETVDIVQIAYGSSRRIEERQSERLRDSLLRSAFQFVEFNAQRPMDLDSWKEEEKLLKRKEEIRDAVSKMEGKSDELLSEVDRFFDKAKQMFDSLRQTTRDGRISIDWLANKAQIERVSSLVKVIDEHKSRVDDAFKPINLFLDTVNSFYKDSGKEVSVDNIGTLLVRRPDKSECSVEGLSSGERQLLVIFAHGFLRPRREKNPVIIIDEPELSLHVRWQERFSDAIKDMSPDSQFVLATHSPEIIGEDKSKVVRCRKSDV